MTEQTFIPQANVTTMENLIKFVLNNPEHEDLIIPKAMLGNLSEFGFCESIGELQGQLRDFRLALPDRRGIHIREYNDYYKMHWDIVDPHTDPMNHLRYDAPHFFVVGALALGMLIGAAYTPRNRRVGGIYGALIGLCFGLALLPQQQTGG